MLPNEILLIFIIYENKVKFLNIAIKFILSLDSKDDTKLI